MPDETGSAVSFCGRLANFLRLNRPSNLCLALWATTFCHLYVTHELITCLTCLSSEQETECCGVYCCLLYIGHWSPEYSCHTHTHTFCQWLLLLILLPPHSYLCSLVLSPPPVDSRDLFLYFFTCVCCFVHVVLSLSSLFLCYIVKLTYFTSGEGSDSVFSVDITWIRFLGSGFLWERWDANVSTLYNDGQLCIYCLFIVDLYIKEMSILYISIHNEILWSCFWSRYWNTILFVGPAYSRPFFFGCYWRRRRLSWVTVGYVLSSILLAVCSSFNSEDQFFTLFIPLEP